jgi:SNF2 family DNA or RNA helicase
LEAKFSLPEDLFEFQKEDYIKIAGDGNWLDFSEMGTGKTPITLAVIESNKYQCPLVICPNSLKYEWKRQIEDWTDEDAALSSPDCYFRLEPIYRSFQNNQKYKIINYETLRNKNHIELLRIIPFDCIVFDEIHKLRNPKTKQVRGVWEFLNSLKTTPKIIGLSGSPIMNYPNDLYVPLSVTHPEVYPRTLRDWKIFMYKYCMWSDGRYGPYIYGTRNLPRLREETSNFTIRRTKKEVLPFLPNKYYRRVLLEMPSDQRKLYDRMERDLKILLDTGEPLWSTNVLSMLTRLRQINLDPKIIGVTANSAKTEFLLDLIESTDEKLVIFSCFEKYIYLLSSVYLRNTPHVVVTGEIPNSQRLENVRKFQEDPSVKVFLGTIQTAGEGITLTEASTVVLVDRWWNQPTCNQAIDRLHRIGQHSGVQVIYPICQNSVDEILDAILERKNQMTDEYLQESQVREEVLSAF